MKRGYTLVEMLIYVTILAFLAAVLVSGIVLLIRSFGEVRAVRNLADAGGAALERITREVRQAKSVDGANSLFNQTPGRLKLNTIDGAGSPTTVEFTVTNNVLTVQTGSGAVGNLLPAHLLLSSLIFRQLATTTATAIKVEAALQDDRRPNVSPINFYTTAVLRGSY